MGSYKYPSQVKLVVGMLGADREILERARGILRDRFGPEEEVMAPIPFTWTQYYADEVGPAPFRTFVSYEPLLDRETLVEIKRYTNEVEMRFAPDGPRRVNLDPGYLTLGQLFLATTKDQRHRVYIRDGIFVEPTLYFQEGRFLPFEWTYRDYRSEEYRNYFETARAKLAFQLRAGGEPYSRRKGLKGGKDRGSDQERDPGSPASPGKPGEESGAGNRKPGIRDPGDQI